MISLIIQLVTEIAKVVNTEKTRKYVDLVAETKEEILEEKNKGQLADDRKLEILEKQLHIYAEAAVNELALFNAKK